MQTDKLKWLAKANIIIHIAKEVRCCQTFQKVLELCILSVKPAKQSSNIQNYETQSKPFILVRMIDTSLQEECLTGLMTASICHIVNGAWIFVWQLYPETIFFASSTTYFYHLPFPSRRSFASLIFAAKYGEPPEKWYTNIIYAVVKISITYVTASFNANTRPPHSPLSGWFISMILLCASLTLALLAEGLHEQIKKKFL